MKYLVSNIQQQKAKRIALIQFASSDLHLVGALVRHRLRGREREVGGTDDDASLFHGVGAETGGFVPGAV